jgi:hypothetical protein
MVDLCISVENENAAPKAFAAIIKNKLHIVRSTKTDV